MDEIEVTIKSTLPADEAQGVYRLHIGRQETVEKLLRNLCRDSQSILRDEYCLRSEENQLLNRSDTIADNGLQDRAFLHWTYESTKKKGLCCTCNLFSALAALSLTIGITGIIALCIIKYKPSNPIVDYAIVFDAGSSHTAMFIYKWDGSKFNGTALAVQSGEKCPVKGPGISSYVDHPEDAGKSLQACLKDAKSSIPKDKHSTTPVYLGATAGMRLLNISHPNQSEAIMTSIRSTLSASSFKFTNPESSARIISGFDEGSFSWITSNYVTNSFDVLKYRKDIHGVPPNTFVPTLGALDLGGASTQISFIPGNDDVLMPDGYSNELELFGRTYKLYTHSYLCYGMSEVQNRVLAYLVNENSSVSEIVHECLPEGFNLTKSHEDIFASPCVHGDTAKKTFGYSIDPLLEKDINHTHTFLGTGDTAGCHKLTSKVIVNASVPCPFTSCSFNGIYQPSVKGPFYAFSSFFITTSFLNLTKPGHRYFDRETLVNATNRLCTMPWDILKTFHVSKKYLPWYCQDAVYIDVLMYQGYHFKDEAWLDVNFVDKIANTEIGWTLGFVLNESNDFPSDKPGIIINTLTFALLLVLFGLFLLVGIALAWHGTRAGYGSVLKLGKTNSYRAI